MCRLSDAHRARCQLRSWFFGHSPLYPSVVPTAWSLSLYVERRQSAFQYLQSLPFEVERDKCWKVNLSGENSLKQRRVFAYSIVSFAFLMDLTSTSIISVPFVTSYPSLIMWCPYGRAAIRMAVAYFRQLNSRSAVTRTAFPISVIYRHPLYCLTG